MQEFSIAVIKIIKSIPKGKVSTYKSIATIAGNHRASRQVARILHSCSKKYKLPWHRVINAQGYVSLPKGCGFEAQIESLRNENVFVTPCGKVNLKKFLRHPDESQYLYF